MKKSIIKLIILYILIGLRFLFPQWKATTEEDNIINASPFEQSNPSIISDGKGGAFIAWEDRRDYLTSGVDIYIQRVDKDGFLIFPEEGIPLCTADGAQTSPKIIGDGNGNAIVFWFDSRENFTNATDLYAQKIDPDGNILWEENGVPVSDFSSSTPGAVNYFNLINDSRNGVIAVWSRLYFGYSQLRAQRISSDGNIMWDSTGAIITDGARDDRSPQVLKDTLTGGAIIIFRGGSNYSILAQRIDSTGKSLWVQPVIASPSGPQGPTSITEGDLKTNGSIVTFSWSRNSAGLNGNVYAQQIDTAGNKLWGEDGVVVNGTQGGHTLIKIFKDEKDTANYYLVWRDGRRVNVAYDIYAQKLNSKGEPQWTPDGIFVTGTPYTFMGEPQLVYDGENIITTWEDIRQDAQGIYAQKILEDSSLAWGDGFYLSSKIVSPVMIYNKGEDSEEGAIIVFAGTGEPSGTGSNIYAKKFRKNGTFSGITGINENENIVNNYQLFQNYPNPFNPATKISWQTSVSNWHTLKIYDILGNEVATLVNEEKSPGFYEIEFNASNLSSGIYFYRLSAGNFLQTRKMILIK